MSTNIYTREECKQLISELGIISYNETSVNIRKKAITPQLMESILFHTDKCRDKISERIYWILNNINDYPPCMECRKQFLSKFYGFKDAYHDQKFCSSKCSNSNKKVKEKKIETSINNWGYENPAQHPDVQAKMQATCEERYGYKNVWSSPEIRKQIEETNLERYDVRNVFTSIIFKEKIKLTHLKNLNVENPAQSPAVQAKMQATCEERYGYKNVWSSPEIRKQIEQTYLKKYDAIHPMQNVDILQKQQNNAFKLKTLTLPSGTQVTYQGYEDVAILALLDNGYLEEQLVIDNKLIPSFKYDFEDKGRIYYPDLYIPDENLIIEVKSTYTYSKELSKNEAKRQACLDAGYRFEFWICSDKEVMEIL